MPQSEPQAPADIAQGKNQRPVQPKLRTFPLSAMKGQQRSFNSRWYTDYPFIEYSIQKDAVYCFPCRFFPSLSHKAEATFDIFTDKGMHDWEKLRSKLEKHSKSDCHKHSVALWMGYKQARGHGTVCDQLSSERVKNYSGEQAVSQVNLSSCCSVCQARHRFKRVS